MAGGRTSACACVQHSETHGHDGMEQTAQVTLSKLASAQGWEELDLLCFLREQEAAGVVVDEISGASGDASSVSVIETNGVSGEEISAAGEPHARSGMQAAAVFLRTRHSEQVRDQVFRCVGDSLYMSDQFKRTPHWVSLLRWLPLSGCLGKLDPRKATGWGFLASATAKGLKLRLGAWEATSGTNPLKPQN
eukprot:1161341-Pelagomonas_calceolata.AAC.18